ncbi:hypothetical protein BCR39DRAFT_261103 [Naematelia encephala]|uniref:MARVEL domain-containing protein n=1 Tax=Naematelia encephala TaxID=71784 RepID=A0A1Y2AVC6_9TREE|nr:hypothetical protein BCR39DRAFT_261103 [Naematelia encephala]
MEKLRSLTSKLPTFSSSSPSSKLTKAFRFNKSTGVLGSPNNSGNPFSDGQSYEDASLPKVHLILHCVALFFTFLAICTMAAVAAFQAKWFSVSGGTGFTLFILILSFIISALLVMVPVIYDRWDKLKRPAQFFAQTRSTLILHAFGTGLMILAAFIVTISAWTEKGCKDADNDPHSSLGDSFKSGLKQWCNTKKASAIFDWLSFGAWCGLLVLSALLFRRERRRDPSFTAPADYPTSSGVGISSSMTYSNMPDHDDHHGERYYNKESSHVDSTDPYAVSAARAYSYSQPQPRPQPQQVARGSVDAYGAFDDDSMPMEESSRTMQLAYDDPYSQIRANLMSTPAPGGYVQPQGTLYSQGGLPNPPTYGYR